MLYLELLLALLACLRPCGPKLLRLVSSNHTFQELDSKIVEPGQLVRNAGIEGAEFSVDREVSEGKDLRMLIDAKMLNQQRTQEEAFV